MRMWGSPWTLACSACVAACGGRELAVDRPVGPLDVASVTDHVVLVDHGRSEAFLLDVSGPGAPGHPSVVPLPANPAHLAPRSGHPDQLLVLSLGHADDGLAAPEQPGLTVLDAGGKNRAFRYDAAFDALEQSADGGTALLHFAPGSTGSGDALFNPNEYAIVDLDGKTDPARSSFRNLGGGAVTRVEFSPPGFAVDGAPRRLAVVLFDTYLSILDLEHPDRSEVSVPLTNDASGRFSLTQVVFSATQPKLYVRAKGADDVFVVTLSPRPGDTKKNDFSLSVTQLAAGSGPSDIALYQEGDQARLLVAAPGSQEVVVVDSDTSNVTNVPLGTAGQKIFLFNGPSPSDSVEKERALVYTEGSARVTFVDLEKLEERGASNVEALTLAETYGTPIPLDAHSLMLPHTGTGLSVVQLGDRTVTQISGPSLDGAVSDPAAGKLWLRHGDRVGFLELSGFLPNEVRVDAPIDALVTVASKTPRVVVTHPSSMGWATVLDAKHPTNLAAAYSMRGFLFDSILEGGG